MVHRSVFGLFAVALFAVALLSVGSAEATFGNAVSDRASVAAPANSKNPLIVPDVLGMTTRYHSVLPWKAVRVQRRMMLGERLKCDNQCRMHLYDGTTVTLEAGAIVVAASPAFFQFDKTQMAKRCQVVHLIEGTIQVFRPGYARNPTVVVGPPKIQVAVYHGRARMRRTSKRLAVLPEDGQTFKHKASRWSRLDNSRVYTIERGQPTRSRLFVHTPTWAPRQKGHRPIGLAAEHPLAEVGARFVSVVGVKTYNVEIANEPNFKGTLRHVVVKGQKSQFSVMLGEGKYFARMRVVDVDGLVSGYSAPLSLRVVRMALPQGGFMPASHIVVLPPDATSRLLDTRDLEMAIDRAGFRRAPTLIRSPSHARHDLRFRIRGQPDTETTFRLERRALRAEITLSPRLPMWPLDPIAVLVKITDPSGYTDPDALEPLFRVTVAGREIPTRWRRRGNTWRTDISGQAISDPSLVEVVVLDANGDRLGWGFVEVLASRSRVARHP